MGKTLGTLIEVAAVGVLAATGVGAIAGLAAFGTLAGVGIGSVGLATLATVGTTAFALGQSLGGTLFGPKSPKPATTEQSVKQSAPPRVSGCGLNRRSTVVIL